MHLQGAPQNHGPYYTYNTAHIAANAYTPKNNPFTMQSSLNRGMYFFRGNRRSLNGVAILIALCLPWLLFCTIFWILTSSLHYKQPWLTEILTFGAFICVVCPPAIFAADTCRKKYTNPAESARQPSWYVFIAITCLVSFLCALVAGSWDYVKFMQPYYSLQSLGQYKDIDTNDYLGQQLMDAGRIDFKNGTVLDISRSMGFKNKDIYCVAPIVTGGRAASSTALSIDFWAVGKNCCSGVSADFHCGGFNEAANSGVLRMLHDEDRAFYRLAVQQAEATYQMTANHPLFFTWVRHADLATENLRYHGNMHFLGYAIGYFLLQGTLTAVATFVFAKMTNP